MRNRLLPTLAAAAVTLALGTVAASAASAYATSSVNVRSGPGTGYGVVDTLRPGEGVNIDRCVGSWCFVEKSGPDGWVSANYLARDRGSRYDDDRRYYVVPPHRPAYRPYGYRPYGYGYRPYGSACVGGRSASFCIGY